jgi:hypothetical protein
LLLIVLCFLQFTYTRHCVLLDFCYSCLLFNIVLYCSYAIMAYQLTNYCGLLESFIVVCCGNSYFGLASGSLTTANPRECTRSEHDWLGLARPHRFSRIALTVVQDWIQFLKFQRIAIFDLNGTYMCTKDLWITPPCQDIINEIHAVTLNCWNYRKTLTTLGMEFFILVLNLHYGTHYSNKALWSLLHHWCDRTRG